MAKTCLDRYKQIIRITRTTAAICGGDFLKLKYKMNFLTWMVIVSINLYLCCTIYTIYVGLVLNGDWKIILEALSLAGSAVQGYSKMLLGIWRQKILISMNKKLHCIYKDYETDEDFLSILRYRTDLTTKILKTIMSAYIMGSVIIIFYPLIYGQIYDIKLLIMAFFIPGIDPETYEGYIIHNMVHAFLIFLGGFGNFAADMFIFIFIIHVPLLKDIVKVKCEKLSRLLLSTRDEKVTIPHLLDIIMWHQSYNTFAQEVDDAYYIVIFVQIFTSVIGISCTLFSIVIRSWPAAFAYLVYSFVILYTYCGLGHLVEISNDELIDLIYADCLWYELPTAQQKLVLLMLRKAQAPINLTVGQIMPLSMSTALQLTKAIYSYMMMLVNFLDT